MDNIIFIEANTIKSFNDETGEIGEYSVVFGNDKSKDFHGNWFTKNTFLGHNNGDGAVAFINHRVPLFKKGQFDDATEKALKSIADMRMKNPVHTTVDDVGVFSKLVLNLSDKYEKMVYELAKQGVFKWSSGTGPQGYKALPSGELEMFVIFEKSLTPMPAEYRMLEHRVMPLKAYTDLLRSNPRTPELNDSQVVNFLKAYQANSFLEAMKGGKGSGFFGHAGRDAENLRGGSVRASRSHTVDQIDPRKEKPISNFRKPAKNVGSLLEANKSVEGQIRFLEAEMQLRNRKVALSYLRDRSQRHAIYPKEAIEVLKQSPNLLWHIEYAGPGE